MALADWIEAHMIPCPVKLHTGFDCPSCGMQRGIMHLLRGEVLESIYVFPALIPMLIMVLMLIAQLRFRFSWGPVYLKWNFIIVVALMLGKCLSQFI